MRYILIFVIFITSLYADQVKKKTLACPTIEALKNAPTQTDSDPLELSMYSIANGCEILSRRDGIEAIGYDPRNSQDLFQQVIYKRTGSILYVFRSSITIEQGGKKNIMRF